jgi:ribosome maturation factor RimP
MRESIAVLLASIFWLTPSYCAQEANSPSPQSVAEKASAEPELTAKQGKLRDRMGKVAADSWIEAKVENQQVVTGRLKDVSAQGFTLLIPAPDKLQDQKVSYTELKSFRRVSGIAAKTPTEQALLVPKGSLITVRLKNKEKFQALLEDVSNDGILAQVRQANGTDMRKIPFSDVQAISRAGGSKVETGGKTILWVVIAAGVVFAIIAIVMFATNPSGD